MNREAGTLTFYERQQQWCLGQRFNSDPFNEHVWRVRVGTGEHCFDYYFDNGARAYEFYNAVALTIGKVVLTLPRGTDWGTREQAAS